MSYNRTALSIEVDLDKGIVNLIRNQRYLISKKVLLTSKIDEFEDDLILKSEICDKRLLESLIEEFNSIIEERRIK